MTQQIYIVVEIEPVGTKRICFDGQKPFIGDKNSAQRLANFLASINPKSKFVLSVVRLTKYEGTVDEYLL